ncbi:hypothetical protein C2S51_015045 [Perilla frutescens var. frutescens]|nr:hypothetical protein C2S51_015045 [Perilla frutescens var. frutescens]
MWKFPIDITVRSYSQGHIDCEAELKDKRWRFTGFYGNPESHLRKFSWELIRKLAKDGQMRSLPWLIGGDFNEILLAYEKTGGRSRSSTQMEGFPEVLEECDLVDADEGEQGMTWSNMRGGVKEIWERFCEPLGKNGDYGVITNKARTKQRFSTKLGGNEVQWSGKENSQLKKAAH